MRGGARLCTCVRGMAQACAFTHGHSQHPWPLASHTTLNSALEYGAFPPPLALLGLEPPASRSLSPGPASSLTDGK